MLQPYLFFCDVVVAVGGIAHHQLGYKAREEEQRTYHHCGERDVKRGFVGHAHIFGEPDLVYDELCHQYKPRKEGNSSQHPEEVHGLFAEPAGELDSEQIEKAVDEPLPSKLG